MFDKELLKDWLHEENISLRDKLLLCLATGNYDMKHYSTVAKTAYDAGWDEIGNPLDNSPTLYLRYDETLKIETKGYAVNIGNGWELNRKGKAHVEQLVATLNNQAIPVAASTLRDVLDNITNVDVKVFVEEAISDVEHQAYRSAVVLSWCGAVALLRDHIIKDMKLLDAFNAESRRRNPKWKDVKVHDDFGVMKEYNFLQVLCAVSLKVSRDLKQQLENALKFRNTCGHPNSLDIDVHMVEAHLSMLALNVFAKFG